MLSWLCRRALVLRDLLRVIWLEEKAAALRLEGRHDEADEIDRRAAAIVDARPPPD